MRAIVLACLVSLPASLAADDGIEIGVACSGNVPTAVGVRMKRAGEIIVPLLAVFNYCEEQHRSGKPL